MIYNNFLHVFVLFIKVIIAYGKSERNQLEQDDIPKIV